MSVCHAASIVVDEESVAFFGPQDAHWRVPLAQIRAIGEVRSGSLEDAHCLAILIDASGVWFQAPIRASGMEQSLQRLAVHCGAALVLGLDRAVTDSSRVLWPATLANEPLFEWDEQGRMSVRAHVLRAISKP
ncbi:MAG: hypothetical protein GX535_10120 [Xanthomonadaceae bacterium]|nr:hypothetical protein [Xanthomonadaceae bacterium]